MTSLPVLSCDNCGICCDRQGTPPFTRVNGDQAPAHLEGPLRDPANWDRYDRELPCLWYDPRSRRCLHYEHRPVACREFELSGEDCLRMRAERWV